MTTSFFDGSDMTDNPQGPQSNPGWNPPPGGGSQPGANPPAGGAGQPGWQQPSAGQPPQGYGTPGATPAPGGQGMQPPVGHPGAMGGMAVQAPLATWGKRAQGWLLDYLAPGVVISFIANLMPGNSSAANAGGFGGSVALGTAGSLVLFALNLVWFGILAYTSAGTGQTWGRKWAKTQLLGENGTPIGFGSSFVRYLAHIVDTIICYIGWLFPLWDQQRQTLADKIMKTRVYDLSATPMQQPMGGQPR